MKSVPSALAKVSTKASTGILGFDEITGGGVPRGRTTLLVGGPGSGKTIFALQFLVHGARAFVQPGGAGRSLRGTISDARCEDMNMQGFGINRPLRRKKPI